MHAWHGIEEVEDLMRVTSGDVSTGQISLSRARALSLSSNRCKASSGSSLASPRIADQDTSTGNGKDSARARKGPAQLAYTKLFPFSGGCVGWAYRRDRERLPHLRPSPDAT